MMKTRAILPVVLAASLLAAPTIQAQQPRQGQGQEQSDSLPVPPESSSVTQHTVTVDGQKIQYSATAGTLLVRNDENDPVGSFFYVAYTKDGADPRTRPVTFLYNGGPGSASIWLHMGSVAPVRVVTTDAGDTPPAPYDLEPNPYSLIDRSDLVFVDAIGTGLSRIVGKGEPTDFYGGGPGHPLLRRLHPALHHGEPPLAVAQVPHGRVVRHHALRGTGPGPR
ncbi:MAG: hypothetical protein P8099_10235 [Gemmatimonadota bacterium]